MKQFLTVNFKWFIIAGIAIALLLMWKGCGNDKELKALAELERLQHEKDSVLVEKNAVINIYNRDVLRLTVERDSIELISDYRLKQLGSIKPRVIKLAGDIITKMDSAQCLELAKMQENLLWLIDDYSNQQVLTQIATDSIEAGLRGIIVAKDQQIEVLTKTLDFAVNKVIPVIKPKGAFYAGGGVIGNKTTVFNGYSAGVVYTDKKGGMYGADIMWVNGEQQLQVSYKRRLSFKKH